MSAEANADRVADGDRNDRAAKTGHILMCGRGHGILFGRLRPTP